MDRSRRSWNFSIRLISFARRKEAVPGLTPKKLCFSTWHTPQRLRVILVECGRVGIAPPAKNVLQFSHHCSGGGFGSAPVLRVVGKADTSIFKPAESDHFQTCARSILGTGVQATRIRQDTPAEIGGFNYPTFQVSICPSSMR